MRKILLVFALFSVVLLYCQTLKPYRDKGEMVKDLNRSIKLASKINSTTKADAQHYILLGEAFGLQGIICRRSEITQLSVVQQAFEILQKHQINAQADYIVFTENCRKMYGLYQ